MFSAPFVHPYIPPFIHNALPSSCAAVTLIHEGTGGSKPLHHMSSTFLDRNPIIRDRECCSVKIFQPSVRRPTTPVHVFLHLIHPSIHPSIYISFPVNLPFVHLPIRHPPHPSIHVITTNGLHRIILIVTGVTTATRATPKPASPRRRPSNHCQ